MGGREFLDIAREVIRGATPAHRRAAVGRAYYALFLEAREILRHWGFSAPLNDRAHAFVRLRLTLAADPDLRSVGIELDHLVQFRNKADYDLQSNWFDTDARARAAVTRAETTLALLDAVAADPARSAAAQAYVRARWP
jgi:hypothetical protein